MPVDGAAKQTPASVEDVHDFAGVFAPQSLVREYNDRVGSISYAGGQADIVLDESPRPGGFHRGAGGPT